MLLPSMGWENPLKEGMANHSSILVWRISWMEEPGGLQSIGLQSQTQLKQLSTPTPPSTLLILQLCLSQRTTPFSTQLWSHFLPHRKPLSTHSELPLLLLSTSLKGKPNLHWGAALSSILNKLKFSVSVHWNLLFSKVLEKRPINPFSFSSLSTIKTLIST